MSLKPLYMWAGGKTRLLPKYAPLLPPDICHYVEPFFGGGALFAALQGTPSLRSAVINDVNTELMGLIRHIATDPHTLISHLKILENNYFSAANRKQLYYDLRTHYWAQNPALPETAALLYFLMKTGFNGIWQSCKAANGKFATPAGLLNHKHTLFDYTTILAWHAALQTTTIVSGSYSDLPPLPAQSFIFCDPPYRGSFTSYGQSFSDTDQARLIDWCQSQANRGHTVWLANRTTDDEFFDTHLPNNTTTHHFAVTYTAGRRKQTQAGDYSAKKAHEFIAIFQPTTPATTSKPSEPSPL